jgi:hypothetical protein
MRHTWALGSGSSKGEVIFKHTSVLLIIAFVLSLGLLPQGLDAQTISKQLGGFKIVDLAGIPHLQDKNRYYIFPAFCPTACNAPWARSAGTMGNIGAIVVNFGQPGDYAFFYYIKPLIGEFVNLTTLQVIVLPKGEGTSPLQDVNWYMYPYTIEGVSRFRISNLKLKGYLVGSL